MYQGIRITIASHFAFWEVNLNLQNKSVKKHQKCKAKQQFCKNRICGEVPLIQQFEPSFVYFYAFPGIYLIERCRMKG